MYAIAHDRPFVGSEAISCGFVTREQLRAGSFRRMFRDVYIDRDVPDSLPLRASAALLVAPPGAVLSGRTAAWLHGIDIRPDEPVEVTLPPRTPAWPRGGLLIRRTHLPEHDVALVGGALVTTPLRTGFDLARRKGLVNAVVAIDAFTHAGLLVPGDLLAYAADPSFKGARGIRQVPAVVEHAEPGAESPGETRLRMVIVLGGLPRPEAQIDVRDRQGRHCGRLDLGYRQVRLGIEYDGEHHREAWEEDIQRQNRLRAAGWSLLRYTGNDVTQHPMLIVRQIERALTSRSMLRG
ncbi:MAG: DUF559 domain-containing protein [Streptosporangiales bacterium]|nr:DUF559 domain-containing protein [Streptosporangiales bacterium]